MSNRLLATLLTTSGLAASALWAAPALGQASATADTAGTAPMTQASADGQAGLERVVV